jgi:hypothetical protein
VGDLGPNNFQTNFNAYMTAGALMDASWSALGAKLTAYNTEVSNIYSELSKVNSERFFDCTVSFPNYSDAVY